MKKGKASRWGPLETLFAACLSAALLWVILGDLVALLALLLWVSLGLLCFWRRVRLSGAAMGLLVFGISLAARVCVIALISPPPVSDFAAILDASREFARGDYTFGSRHYFTAWPGQTGQVMLQGWLLRLWDDVMIIKLVNALAGAGTDLLIYLCAKRWFGRRAGCAAALMHGLAMFPLTLTAVLTNQITAGFFTYLAVCILSAAPRRASAVLLRFSLAGACAAIANILRPDGLILLVAVCAYCVFGLAGQFNRAGLVRSGLGLAVFFAVYLCLFEGASFLVSALGVNPRGLASGDLLTKLLFGLNARSGGSYSGRALDAVRELTGQGLSRPEALSRVLKEELPMSPAGWVSLLDRKLNALWKDNGLYWALGHLKTARPYMYECAVKYDGFTSAASLILALLGSLELKRSPRPGSLLPAFIVFAGFCAYLIIEVQPRYVYGLEPALYILAAGGLRAIERLRRFHRLNRTSPSLSPE